MQINRLFEIVHILLNKETVTAKELAERFEVSVRTVYRDIETLSEAGIPVYMSKGRNGGISLMEGYVLNKAVLSQEEKSEILSALQGLKAVTDFEESNALSKLGAMFGENNTDWIEIDFSDWYNQEEIGNIFAVLKQAILSKTLVRFTYFNSNREMAVRLAEPLRLLFKSHAWYLFAFCRNKNDTRLFKLSRIKDLSIVDEHFTRSYTRQIFDVNWCLQDDLTELKLKIDKKMAFRVFDEFDNSLTQTDQDGNFIVTMHYIQREWIFPYLMSFGECLEVLEPIEIIEEVKEKLNEVLKKYK